MKEYIFKHKTLLTLALVLSTLSALLNVSLVFLLKYILDYVVSGEINKLINVGIITVIVTLICNICTYLSEVVKGKYIKKTLIYFKNDIFNGIIRKNVKDFYSNNTSSYISILNNDIYTIELEYLQNMFGACSLMLNFVFAVSSLLIINVNVAIFICIMSIIIALIPIVFSNKLNLAKKDYSEKQSFFVAAMKDLFSGYETIKVFNIEEITKRKFNDINNICENSKYNLSKTLALCKALSITLNSSIVLCIFLLSGYLVIKGSITVGSTVAVLQLVQNVISPITALTVYITRIKSNKSIIQKIESCIDVRSSNTSIKLEHFKKDIEFNNIKFSYEDGMQVLNGVSFKIEKNKKYAFVGDSGCGKSTIFKLLLGYFNNYEGEILIDGIDIKDLNTETLYKNLSHINQNVFIFDDNIKNNITLYSEYSKEKLDKVIHLSELDKFLEKRKLNVEENLKENGFNLSGGEKQRIAIARALIKEKPILLFDEATSSLDNITSFEIENLLLEMESITTIMITHKLVKNILKKFDCIFVIKDGLIIEAGKFSELIDKKGEFYNIYNVN